MKKRKHNLLFYLILIIMIFLFISKHLSTSSNLSRKQFISKMVPYAKKMQAKYGYFASIAIAQAALESNFGKSELGNAPYYNLFGIKYDGKGEYVQFKTLEQTKQGKTYQINAKFQKYNSYSHAFEQYAILFTKTQWLKDYYQDFLQAKTVESSAHALTSTYATDIRYGEKLLQIIDEFQLTQYDDPKQR